MVADKSCGLRKTQAEGVDIVLFFEVITCLLSFSYFSYIGLVKTHVASSPAIMSRPATRILCGGGGGGVLTRPSWTKLPKCIFNCLIRLFRKVATHEIL